MPTVADVVGGNSAFDSLPEAQRDFMRSIKLPDDVRTGNAKLRTEMNKLLATGEGLDPAAEITVTVTQAELTALSGVCGSWLSTVDAKARS